MAENEIGPAPFPPVRLIDQDAPVTAAQLDEILQHAGAGVSLCVRYGKGHSNRGGYFFHARPSDDHRGWTLLDFERHAIAIVEADFLRRFINHCTGREFDNECFEFARNVVNLRSD